MNKKSFRPVPKMDDLDWDITDDVSANLAHLYPLGEAHVLDGTTCMCKPTYDDEDCTLVIHNRQFDANV